VANFTILAAKGDTIGTAGPGNASTREETVSGSFRRIVTGHDDKGRSIIAQDGAISTDPFGLTDFWQTEAHAAPDTSGEPDRPTRLEPPPHGTRFRFFAVAPEPQGLTADQFDALAATAFAALDAGRCRVDTRRHPLMHTTQTIDYIVVMRGAITLLLDAEEVPLKPFDVVIQRGTNHAWVNRGSEPALLMAVLVDAPAS
jgi:hypothetical protein